MKTIKGRRVLLIDDEPEIGKLIELVLASWRRDLVQQATSSPEGLRLAEQNPPDLIILDIMMPEPNGQRVYEQIRRKPALARVPILFTHSGDRSAQAQRMGAAGYLVKPLSWQELLTARDTVLQGQTYFPLLKTGNK